MCYQCLREAQLNALTAATCVLQPLSSGQHQFSGTRVPHPHILSTATPSRRLAALTQGGTPMGPPHPLPGRQGEEWGDPHWASEGWQTTDKEGFPAEGTAWAKAKGGHIWDKLGDKFRCGEHMNSLNFMVLLSAPTSKTCDSTLCLGLCPRPKHSSTW